LNNLALAYPDMPLEERERIAAEMWDNLGRTFAESFRIRKIVEEGRIEFESQAQLDEMIRGGPCVVCGLHLGNWELVDGRAVHRRLSTAEQSLCRRGDAQAATTTQWSRAAARRSRPGLVGIRRIPADIASFSEESSLGQAGAADCDNPRASVKPAST
jgi:lauroyl/myristoyl acyltransferase